MIGGYIYISREIPTFDSVRDYHPFVASKVIAADGSVVGQFYRERRTVVRMDRIPRVLVQAVISAEDKDFYSTRASTSSRCCAPRRWTRSAAASGSAPAPSPSRW